MKIIKGNDIQAREVTNEPLFTGGKVLSTPLIGPETSKEIGVGVVTFSPGARNVFHTHTTEQLLYVTAGKGIVATEKEEIVVTPGMLIHFPAGEKHWHGATKDSSFTHITIAPPHQTNF
ncbi:MAG: cupin domain-containing protein [Chloroflexota bacterium]